MLGLGKQPHLEMSSRHNVSRRFRICMARLACEGSCELASPRVIEILGIDCPVCSVVGSWARRYSVYGCHPSCLGQGHYLCVKALVAARGQQALFFL